MLLNPYRPSRNPEHRLGWGVRFGTWWPAATKSQTKTRNHDNTASRDCAVRAAEIGRQHGNEKPEECEGGKRYHLRRIAGRCAAHDTSRLGRSASTGRV